MKKLLEAALVILTAAAANALTLHEFLPITVPGSVPYTTIPTGINNKYVIAGYYQDSATMGWHGFTYNLNKRTWAYPIDDPNAPAPGATWINAINDSGVVGGYYTLPSSTSTWGMLDSAGVFTDVFMDCIGIGTNINAQVGGIDNVGYTAGSCQTVGFSGPQSLSWVWALGQPAIFTCPANAFNSFANAINNLGQVVGTYTIGNSQGGYVATYGNCVGAVDYAGATFTDLTGINDSGTAIGWALGTSSFAFGFFYDTANGQFTAIAGPAAAKYGWYTGGMNNSGWFVGYYVDKNGNNNGFVSRPIAR
jgi:hypothetical protein